MIQAVNEVLGDSYLKNYISYYAYKLNQRFPNSIGQEDAEQTFWEEIIKSMKSYEGGKSPSDHARSAVFSKYGHMIDKRLKKTVTNEKTYHYDHSECSIELPYIDSCFETVEANITLDAIEQILQKEAEKGRQYSLAVDLFRLKRLGYTTKESAKLLNVTVEYLWTIWHRVVKKVVKNNYRM